jgi:hypothetical protein
MESRGKPHAVDKNGSPGALERRTYMSRLRVMQDLQGDVKDLLRTLHDMGSDAEDCIYLLQTSFIYNSSSHLAECRKKRGDISARGERVAMEIELLLKDHPILGPYAPVVDHLMKIGDEIEKLINVMERKVREGVLFSIKATEEITFLFQRLIDLLGPTSDIILARNEILSKYVQESKVDVERRALEFATLHEERLIEGVCLPVGSTLFLNILDSIKNIAWHANAIAVKLMA